MKDLFDSKEEADRAYDEYVGRCVLRGVEPAYIVEWLFSEAKEVIQWLGEKARTT